MRKSWALLVAMTMGMTALTGCGADTTTTNPPVSGGDTTTTNPPAEGGDVAEVKGIQFPLEKPMEFDFHYHARNKYVFRPEWPVFQELAKRTNITLKNTANEVATNSEEQIQLQAVDGFPSDIYGGNNTTKYFMQYGQDGAFVAINEFWDYLPNFKAYLDANPDVEAVITAPDGNIYHIPYIQDGGVARTYFMRTDWLDNLGLKVPTTVEELEVVLTAFKNDDPNGNGLNDEIPYFNDKWNEMIRLANLWDARVYGMDTYQERVIPTEEDTVYHAWTQPEFKEAIKNIARWYANGLIDQEIFTKGSASRKEYLPKDIGGMTHEWVASTSGYNAKVEIPGFMFETIAPPKSPSGNQWEEHERLKTKPDGWAVSSNCENPAEALAFMDYFYSPEGRILSNFGVEGEHYDMVDGKPVFKDSVLNGDKAVNAFLEEEVGAQLKHGYWMDYEYERQWTNEVGQKGVELYEANDYSVLQMPPLVYTDAEKDTMDRLLSNINAYQDEMIQKWIIGGDPAVVDADWDKYLAELEKLGMQELLDAYQSAYTNYLSIMKK